MTPDEVLAVLDDQPVKVGEVGLRLLDVRGITVTGQGTIGQELATHGISLSAVQQALDALVRDGRARDLRGRELWDGHWPGLGPDAKGRHFTRS